MHQAFAVISETVDGLMIKYVTVVISPIINKNAKVNL